MKLAGLAATLASAVLLLNCGYSGEFDRVKEDFHYTYPLHPGASLRLDNANGSVDIAGWDRDTIDVSGTKFSSSWEQLHRIEVKVDATGDSASVITVVPGFLHRSYSVRYLVRVPVKTQISQAKVVNGTLSVEDLEGGGRLTTVNGKLSLARSQGDYTLETTNGAISFDECTGTETAHTTNGRINGQLKAGGFTGRSVNGPIDVSITSPDSGSTISTSTTNGGVAITLANFRGNSVSAQTTNGSVTLRVPSNTNARVLLQTSSGNIANDFTLSSNVQWSKHQLVGVLGTGGPEIRMSSSRGSIHLERY
jgi:hypothetical protein